MSICPPSIELGGQKTTARVFDLSRGGARIAAIPHVFAGADATVTFSGLSPMKGKVAWIAGGCFGVRFEPVMLEARELLRIAGLDAAAA